VPIGFSFPFYDNNYSDLFVCSNGLLTFGSGSTVYSNDAIPDSDQPNNYIAPWWDDLSPQNGHVYYYYDVTDDRFIVSYVGVPNYGNGGNLNFQAILYPDGDIDFNYATMDPGNDQLNLATIGLENIDASDGLQIVYNANYMHSDMSIIIRSGNWLKVSPASGVVDPSSSLDATVTFDASELTDGIYSGTIFLNSNDPVNPSVEIDVTFNVSSLSGCDYVVGDVNCNGELNGLDVSFAVSYFKGGPAPSYECECTSGNTWYVSGDVNATCFFNGIDVTYLVAYFKGASDPQPCADCPPISLRTTGKSKDVNNPGIIRNNDNSSLKSRESFRK
jgi:hypothetical protein